LICAGSLAFAIGGGHASTADGSRHLPTIDELLTLKTLGGAQISPDGKWVAYLVTAGDFKQDAFVTQIWLAEVATGRNLQLTRGDKSSNNPKWSPDGAWLAFTSNRLEDKNQIFVINPSGGEAVQLTKSETAISNFAWSEDSRNIAYTATEPVPQVSKDRKDYLGDYEVVRRDYNFAHLWTLVVGDALSAPVVGKQRTKKKDRSVDNFSWSPDGTQIAFSATVNPDLIQGITSDVYLLNLADEVVTKLVSQAGPDSDPRWSPDGKQIVFSTVMGETAYFASNSRLAVVPATGGTPRSITDNFDENANLVRWRPDGVYFSGQQKMAVHLFRVDPSSGKVTRLSAPDNLMAAGFSFSRDGKQIAFTAGSPTSLNEVFVSSVDKFSPRALTDMTEQTKSLTLGTREVVSWKSSDGATIEGVLIKPADFDPAKKYPLLCIIHGGPTGIDRPVLLTPDARYYPSDLWVARAALVLKVNYRGSAGYGEKFRKLNLRNLGVGDAWDVLSGVDYLIAKGWVDKDKVACMGWSQGGYISAFLTTHDAARFKAVSVGAGISDWMTYYVNTDIHPFTRQYLKATPWDDPEIYAKTSPITYIKQAKTPTLIQHGAADQRVPLPNAYELYQGLQDNKVPTRLIVYQGFGGIGHGPSKPKSHRATMEHNLEWFDQYFFQTPAKPSSAEK
jgi:dipeptidyl aminopeptidase/acylaminoacyl peptidase